MAEREVRQTEIKSLSLQLLRFRVFARTLLHVLYQQINAPVVVTEKELAHLREGQIIQIGRRVARELPDITSYYDFRNQAHQIWMSIHPDQPTPYEEILIHFNNQRLELGRVYELIATTSQIVGSDFETTL
jgi:hypothetical protein